ncbi:unnamed protein product [Albugo candida]|uniref:Fatty acid desaturase domain-containing protein n=1 Tax=Albugo candida TaxID=65357 RepID=A0A024G861_9STRA|nr:unnamed protein product [Albugo candida]|eukprot:CCI43061.1 unnamed protein product [Albugo candida]
MTAIRSNVRKTAPAETHAEKTNASGSVERSAYQDRVVSLAEAGYVHVEGAPPAFPLEKPKFTLDDIRKAIPPHCFKRELGTSLYYLIKDLIICSSLLYLATHITALPNALRFFVWPVYWSFQGVHMMGLWTIAHECGHQAFSEFTLLNNAIGMILHGAFLVPYHGWRISHRRHHANAANIECDEVFVPPTKSTYERRIWSESLEQSSLYIIWRMIVMFTVGWIPGYLVFNAAGPERYTGKAACHYNPYAVMYRDKERWMIWMSDAVVLFFIGLLGYGVYRTSFDTMFNLYFVPFMIMNAYLVLITYMHHTDTFVPHFRDTEWNWMRGALCSVDRSLGSYVDAAVHHVNDTHVLHHLFSSVPFYHAHEATNAIKPVLGDFYMVDNTPTIRALWRSFSNCKFIDDNEKIVFYKRAL